MHVFAYERSWKAEKMKGNDCLASVFDTEKNEALADSSDVRLSISMETKYYIVHGLKQKF